RCNPLPVGRQAWADTRTQPYRGGAVCLSDVDAVVRFGGPQFLSGKCEGSAVPRQAAEERRLEPRQVALLRRVRRKSLDPDFCLLLGEEYPARSRDVLQNQTAPESQDWPQLSRKRDAVETSIRQPGLRRHQRREPDLVRRRPGEPDHIDPLLRQQ